MRILFRLLGFGLVCLSVVYIVSCGSRDEDDEVAPTALVSAEPADGSTIDANGIITVTFDGVPNSVSVNVGIVKQSGTTLIISGPFTPGPTHTRNYLDRWRSNTYLHCRNIHLRRDRSNP